jgi:hypothetical protein
MKYPDDMCMEQYVQYLEKRVKTLEATMRDMVKLMRELTDKAAALYTKQ